MVANSNWAKLPDTIKSGIFAILGGSIDSQRLGMSLFSKWLWQSIGMF